MSERRRWFDFYAGILFTVGWVLIFLPDGLIQVFGGCLAWVLALYLNRYGA